jgi:hypothetical protein
MDRTEEDVSAQDASAASNAEAIGQSADETSDDDSVFEAPALLRILWADPQNMPEHLALWSIKRFGPRASAAVEKLRASHPDADPAELESLAVERQTLVSMTEGAFVGGPFILLIPVAFCAALLAQGQMALEVAAINGYAPSDQMRGADLLVIQGAYASTDEAGAALAKVARVPKHHGKKLPRGSRWSMIKRMAYMLGMMGSTDEKPSRLRAWFQYALLGAVFLIGLVLPLVWVPYMGWAFRKSSLVMGRRARRFYAEKTTTESGVTVRHTPTVQIAMSAGLIRMVLLLALPIVAAVVVLLTGGDIGGGRWFSAWVLLVVICALATGAWFGYRWVRRRRRLRTASAA